MKWSATKRSRRVLGPLLVAVAFGTSLGCSPEPEKDTPAQSAQSPTEQEDARLNAFFEDVFERRVADSPIRQSMLGRKTDRLGEWDDISDAFATEQMSKIRADFETLQTDFNREALGDQAKLSYDLFVLNTQRSLENHRYRKHFYVVDQFNGQLSGLITVLQNNHPVNDLQDAEDYLSRINGLGPVLQEFTSQLRDRAEFGNLPPAFRLPGGDCGCEVDQLRLSARG